LTGALLLFGGAAEAQAPASGRVANIEKAAAEIAVIQEQKGNDGAEAAIKACYDRELPKAKELTASLEACMAQDIIVAKISAGFYANVSKNLSEEQRKKAGIPNPADVTKAMADRIYAVLLKLRVPEPDARAFSQIVQTKGMEAFARTRFPKEFPNKTQ
jgi:hypothetical protein